MPVKTITHTDRLGLIIRNRTGCLAVVDFADVVASSALPDGRLRFIVYKDQVPLHLPPSEWWRVVIPSREQALRVHTVRENRDGSVVFDADLTPLFKNEQEALHRVHAC